MGSVESGGSREIGPKALHEYTPEQIQQGIAYIRSLPTTVEVQEPKLRMEGNDLHPMSEYVFEKFRSINKSIDQLGTLVMLSKNYLSGCLIKDIFQNYHHKPLDNIPVGDQELNISRKDYVLLISKIAADFDELEDPTVVRALYDNNRMKFGTFINILGGVSEWLLHLISDTDDEFFKPYKEKLPDFVALATKFREQRTFSEEEKLEIVKEMDSSCEWLLTQVSFEDTKSA